MKAVIVDWLRSPFHRAHKGKLANVRPDEMAGQVIRELMKRNNLSGTMTVSYTHLTLPTILLV